jgi:proteic killer suppression protein
MIENIRHKGLRKFYEEGETRFLPAEQLDKIRRMLSYLDAAQRPDAMNLPGFRFHQLTGNYKGFYSVTVTGNWRIIFRFQDGQALDVNYLDYH